MGQGHVMVDTNERRTFDRWSVDVEAARHGTKPSRYLLAVLTGSVVLGHYDVAWGYDAESEAGD